MKDINAIKALSFSGKHIVAKFIENVENYFVSGYTIVINVGTKDAMVGNEPRKPIPPLNSTILKDTIINSGDSLILLHVSDTRNIGNIIFEKGWKRYADTIVETSPNLNESSNSFPLNTPLWISSQDDLCEIKFDPYKLLGQQNTTENTTKFLVKANLWFAPSKTDCFIHNQHDFIEVHTQILGDGRMQKFKEQKHSTLYEDILMKSGYTTPIPFCDITENGNFIYPWHQYYADNDCIWLAIEYHPLFSI